MGSNPKISVVMICYNHEKYIGEAINSILSQTYSNFELIIVNDGSTDNTSKIIQEFKDPRIIVVEQENSGPSIALNTGINKSRGQFIAFMSGDDISLQDRLMKQIEQIKSQKADIIFCLPQIIGPNSKVIKDNACPWFFQRNFDNTAELYSQLFYFGNFLCAPSCFCRRTAIAKVGKFKRGLIQLQDFDYWIRACKKKLVIKLNEEPLIQYRYLFGGNLSSRRNRNRVKVETLAIYRNFFDEAPIDLFLDSFGEKIIPSARHDCRDIEIDKSFLLLEHSSPIVNTIGIERIILELEDDEIYKKLRVERKFDTIKFFQFMRSNKIDEIYDIGNKKKAIVFIKNLLRYLGLLVTNGPRWTETRVKERIQQDLKRGNYKEAISLARGYQKFPPGLTMFATLSKVLKKISARIHTINVEITNTFIPRPVMEGVFTVNRMYDYSKKTNCIVYEEPSSKIFLEKPQVLGSYNGNLFEGEAFCPRVYVSEINCVVITGGSNLVISQTGDLLSDEMMDFPSEDFGIKSPYISFRQNNHVILTYRKKPNTDIEEGILISCEHDNNYFHWLVECLPKLVYIDKFKKYKDLPLLIPSGLHDNLVAALDLVNIKKHPIRLLDPGIAYNVKHLIFPSGLSRIVDRYKGTAVFDTDIIFSPKWISKVGEILKHHAHLNTKPWRKLFLTRRRGARALGNLKEIELTLYRNGFEIIDLEHVSLDYQIKLFAEASVIVAPTGATLTNMLLCKPGTKVIIFMSNHETTNFYFWSYLGNITNLDVKIIAGERLYNLTDKWSVHDDYVIDLKVLRKEIKKLNLS
jgi:glycosyltransferase involved in cell wall biosynthesis